MRLIRPAHLPLSLNRTTLQVGGLAVFLIGSTLGSAFNLIPMPAQAAEASAAGASDVGPQRLALGIVRSAENTAQWSQITARLQATGLTYQTLELNQIHQASDLTGVTVLFLPNVEVITLEQVAALEQWVNRGGRLIASGPVGNLSESEVRQRLRSLLGAYWAFPLAQPAALRLTNDPAHPWARSAPSSDSVWGGVVLPTNAISQAVALWQNAPASQRQAEPSLFSDERAVAIITNERATFLGWRWGMSSAQSEQFDSRWLRAALSRYAGAAIAPMPTESATTANQTAPAQPIDNAQAFDQAQRFRVLNRSAATQVDPAGSGAVPSGAAIASPEQLPPPGLEQALGNRRRFTVPNSSVDPIARFRVRPADATNRPTSPAADPAQQVAPAGLEVTPSPLPINNYDALVMRQELENLIGRYESALLAARTWETEADLRADASTEPVLAASATGAGLEGARAESLPPALQQAQSLLSDWSGLMQQREYATARQRWLDVRRSLWDNFPTDQHFAQPEVRAVWLDRGTIVAARSPEGLARVFDRLAAAGVNTVFFETVNAGYPIFPSRVAPQQNPLVRGWDPLKAAVELAHDRNMELHAWVWTFAAGNRAHNRLVNQPADYLGPVLTAHPDWANYDNRGSMIPPGQDKPFLDPANPAVRSYLLQLFGEIAQNYDVDGIQLDYIRYPFQDPGANRTYGYGTAARQQFQRLTGVDPTQLSPRDLAQASPDDRIRQRRLWQEWTEFRTEQVNSFVAEASRFLKQQRPGLVVSAAVFPHSEHERLQKIQQNWEVWAQRGDVDLIVLMSYTQDSNRLERLTRPWLVEQNFNSALVLPGIRLLNLSDEVALDQIQTLRDMPTGGYALFAAENLDDSFHNILRRTQGQGNEASEPIPYRQPFETAAARYDALMREWSWLLAHRQLSVRMPNQDQWITEAEELERTLKTLADSPSHRNLERARARLNRFREKFRASVQVDSVSSRYRIAAWENRLATLATLLNYGERTVLNQQASQGPEAVNQAQAAIPQE